MLECIHSEIYIIFIKFVTNLRIFVELILDSKFYNT